MNFFEMRKAMDNRYNKIFETASETCFFEVEIDLHNATSLQKKNYTNFDNKRKKLKSDMDKFVLDASHLLSEYIEIVNQTSFDREISDFEAGKQIAVARMAGDNTLAENLDSLVNINNRMVDVVKITLACLDEAGQVYYALKGLAIEIDSEEKAEV